MVEALLIFGRFCGFAFNIEIGSLNNVLESGILSPDHLDGKVLMLTAEEGEVVLISWIKELLR